MDSRGRVVRGVDNARKAVGDMIEGGTGDVSRVCLIGATGRSGSTLVSRVLGSVPGAFSVGELCWLWTYGVLRNRACGCGQPSSSVRSGPGSASARSAAGTRSTPSGPTSCGAG